MNKDTTSLSRIARAVTSVAGTLLLLIAAALPLRAQSITVLYPNGGESFRADSTITVRWTATGIDDELEVEFSTDGGQRWRRIGRTSGNATSMQWTVDDRISTNALVRVITKDEDVSDVSDAPFSITENPLDMAIVFAPNGGEVWTVGEKRTISWQLPLDAVDALIELSTNGGTVWQEIARVPATTTRYEWTVPELSPTPIEFAVIRVSMAEAADHFDISDLPFRINPKSVTPPPVTPKLTVIYPNGGEQFRVDSLIDVRWIATDLGTDEEGEEDEMELTVEYSTDGGETWSEIATEDAEDGAHDWLIPNTPTKRALVRVRSADGTIVDVSDAMFEIIGDDTPVENVIRLVAPNGGERWREGERRMIEWTVPTGIDNVRLEISTDNAATWTTIATTAVGSGRFEWRVPHVASVPTSAWIRVTGVENTALTDLSDGTITIDPIAVAGIEEIATGTRGLGIFPNPLSGSATVQWQQERNDEVTVRIHDRTGRLVREIAAGARAAGEQRLELRAEDLPTGVYILEIRGAATVARTTMTVVR